MMKLVMIGAILVMVLAGCTSTAIEVTDGPPLLEPIGFAAATIDTAQVTWGTVAQLVIGHGVVRVESVPLSFEVSGQIANVYVFPGAFVQAGQLLARLDTGDIDEEITQQVQHIADLNRAAVIADEISALEIALKWLDYEDAMHRAAQTFETQAIQNAENILVEIEYMELANIQSAQMRELDIANANRHLNALRLQIEGTELRAPSAGTITHLASLEHVNANQIFMYINHETRLFVEDVSEDLPLEVRTAPRIEARINGLTYQLTYTPMTLQEVAIAQQRRYPMRWRFDITPQPDGTLPPLGAYASIVYSVEFQENALRVPSNAMRSIVFDDFVYLMIDGERILTPVRTGAVSDTFVEILEGLEEGDVVLVR
ncbi:MAG: biotin/lipoyl-binding protein [Defluviitaleaceae bacterium]|nr:biotin/lipoyl-binding protein [Defluviitaleaceae bacterium]